MGITHVLGIVVENVLPFWPLPDQPPEAIMLGYTRGVFKYWFLLFVGIFFSSSAKRLIKQPTVNIPLIQKKATSYSRLFFKW